METTDFSIPGRKSFLRNLLAEKLPEDQRADFRLLTEDISSKDFYKMLQIYFDEEALPTEIAAYVLNQLEEMEQLTGCRIDAVISVFGSKYDYRCFNEVMQV